MLNKIMIFIFSIIGILNFSATYASSEDDILGTWINQAGDGMIEISVQQGKHIGIIKGSSDPAGENRKDVNNPNPELRDRELRGVKIIGDLHYQSAKKKWLGGWIYDPNNGKTYKCKAALNDSNELEIRGYIGVPAFGRTEVWKRKTDS